MSGTPRCAFTEPSTYSIMECTQLCGCTTTRTASAPTPKRWQASMTSRPLFMSVAESMEIFGPMFQVGCARASSRVTCASCPRSRPRKGPPLQVSHMRAISRAFSPARHCHMAECSLSTGKSCPGLASGMSKSPPTTRDSLLASASLRPAARVAQLALRPAAPDMAFTTRSTSSSCVKATTASAPKPTAAELSRRPSAAAPATPSSPKATCRTPNSQAASTTCSTRRPAASATTCTASGCMRATSRVCTPIEPVAPSTAMRTGGVSAAAPSAAPAAPAAPFTMSSPASSITHPRKAWTARARHTAPRRWSHKRPRTQR